MNLHNTPLSSLVPLLLITACLPEKPDTLVCGEGTHEEDGACVADPATGDDTGEPTGDDGGGEGGSEGGAESGEGGGEEGGGEARDHRSSRGSIRNSSTVLVFPLPITMRSPLSSRVSSGAGRRWS